MKAKGGISMAERRPEGLEHIVHGFDPVWDARARVLVLGTLPSVKSREQNFYYGKGAAARKRRRAVGRGA